MENQISMQFFNISLRTSLLGVIFEFGFTAVEGAAVRAIPSSASYEYRRAARPAESELEWGCGVP